MMKEYPKVVFSQEALGDAPPDVIAKIAVDFQIRLTTGGIEGLVAASTDVHFIEDADVRCFECGGPLGSDKHMPSHPEMLGCYATPACEKNSYILASSEIGISLIEGLEEVEERRKRRRADKNPEEPKV